MQPVSRGLQPVGGAVGKQLLPSASAFFRAGASTSCFRWPYSDGRPCRSSVQCVGPVLARHREGLAPPSFVLLSSLRIVSQGAELLVTGSMGRESR